MHVLHQKHTLIQILARQLIIKTTLPYTHPTYTIAKSALLHVSEYPRLCCRAPTIFESTPEKHTARQHEQKHLDHQSATTDIPKADPPFQVYQNPSAPGTPKHPLTPICAPGVLGRERDRIKQGIKLAKFIETMLQTDDEKLNHKIRPHQKTPRIACERLCETDFIDF